MYNRGVGDRSRVEKRRRTGKGFELALAVIGP